jgi:23S rRNA pseudouridine2605 synthase
MAIVPSRQHTVIAYHKPVGELTTRQDGEGRRVVFDALPSLPRGRWINVGRLDINTSGLLLFTTDGELAHRLMHPSFEIQRQYDVRILGELSVEQIQQLKAGVTLEDGMARFESVGGGRGSGANNWYRVSLKEGRNREVRRLIEGVGGVVSRLLRIAFGPVELGRLRRGQSRILESDEAQKLYSAVGLSDRRP